MPSRAKAVRRPTEAQVRDAILADLTDEEGVFLAPLPLGRAHIVGVCRLTLDVRVQRSKSLFQPTEQVVQRTVGQMFMVICHRPPKEDEEFVPPDADLSWAEGTERASGALVVIATSAEDCRDQLRRRGLPL